MPSSRLRPFVRLALAAIPVAVLGGLAVAPAHASVSAPVTDVPVTDVPVSDVPVTDAPVAGAPVADDPSAEHRGRYVALGDSYASGFGLEPYSSLPVAGCLQSEVDYPHRVADALELRVTDVTCAGASTANVIDTPQRTASGLLAPPQSDALSTRTEVVTLTIGGNDLGFSTVLPQCLAASAAGPLLGDPSVPNCESVLAPGGLDTLALRLRDEVLPAVSGALEVIAEKAPFAIVVVVGYPSIFPSPADTPEGGCFVPAFGDGTPPFPENSFPFTDVDTAYFHRTQAALEAGLGQVAAEHGATFVPAMARSAGHEPCGTDAWVNGLTFTSPVAVRDGGLHPNEAGVAFLTEEVATAVAGR
ncbi:SGNH/GDSL hydrolase family protein [Agromyces silvae]|uniref:SGNH/GDSL hydrolase family protein n=1 Tax=Agromyces silvae TaxID=3388266 RepID=UPI00280B6063|nr:SGNH/GDSL hydrolase family protein [Agromyces protaetiae]